LELTNTGRILFPMNIRKYPITGLVFNVENSVPIEREDNRSPLIENIEDMKHNIRMNYRIRVAPYAEMSKDFWQGPRVPVWQVAYHGKMVPIHFPENIFPNHEILKIIYPND